MNPKILKQVERAAVQYEQARSQIKQEKKALRKAKAKRQHMEEAQAFLQEVAQLVQQKAHERIAAVVVRCFDLVFGKGVYGFKVEFKRARGKTEAKLHLTENGQPLDPLEECSFGVIDVASFALRLAALLQHQPPIRKLLILDEPFRHLHMSEEKHREKVMVMLNTLSQELGVQFVVITNQTEFVDSGIGTIIRLER